MSEVGARCFLIGESLMRQDDIAGAVRDLLAPGETDQRASA
jgi:indole-3-glycerol phosphate synthase